MLSKKYPMFLKQLCSYQVQLLKFPYRQGKTEQIKKTLRWLLLQILWRVSKHVQQKKWTIKNQLHFLKKFKQMQLFRQMLGTWQRKLLEQKKKELKKKWPSVFRMLKEVLQYIPLFWSFWWYKQLLLTKYLRKTCILQVIKVFTLPKSLLLSKKVCSKLLQHLS